MRFQAMAFWCCVAALLAGRASAQQPRDPAQRAALVVYVADSAGKPLPAALITLGGGRSALTDSTGHARIDGLEPGNARVQVSRIGYLGADTLLRIPQPGQEIRLATQLRATPVSVTGVTATAVPDSAFVGSYSLDWHAQSTTIPGNGLQIQRDGNGFVVTYTPSGGSPMTGERVRVRGNTLSFTVTGRSPLQMTLIFRGGVITGRWQAMNGASGRLTGRKRA